MTRRFLLCRRHWFLLATLLSVAAFGVGQQLPSPQQLVQASNTATDLAETGPYRLQATVVVFESGRKVGTGHLTLDRDGDNVREEMSFTDYQETSVITGGKLYLVRKPVVPLRFVERIRNLDRLWIITLPAAAVAGEAKQQTVHDAPALCFDLRLDKQSSMRSCFDASSRLLISHETKTLADSPKVLFSDYQPFAGKKYPATVRSLTHAGKPVVEAHDITLTAMQFESDHFKPLPGGVEYRTCRDMQPPRVTSTVEPHYPPLARQAHIQGVVSILAIIGTDGKLTPTEVLRGHPILAKASLEALREWKYVPAMCPDGPVATEIELRIEFHMM